MAKTVKTLTVAAGLSVVLLVDLGVYLSPLAPGVVALQLTWSPEAFAAMLHAWGPVTR